MSISELKSNYLYIDNDDTMNVVVLCIDAKTKIFKDVYFIDNPNKVGSLMNYNWIWEENRRHDYKEALTLMGPKSDFSDLFV